MLSTVAVTSRKAYIFLSNGTILSLYPINPTPVLLATSTNSSFVVLNLKFLIDSNLSIVPPVWPRPLPESFVVAIPTADKIGPNTTVTLSPTPPVECLSTK